MSKVLNVVLDVAESAIDYVQLGLFTSVVYKYKYLLVIFGVSPRVVKSYARSTHISYRLDPLHYHKENNRSWHLRSRIIRVTIVNHRHRSVTMSADQNICVAFCAHNDGRTVNMSYQIVPWFRAQVVRFRVFDDMLCGCLHQVDESIS